MGPPIGQKEKLVLVIIPFTRWKAWLIDVFYDKKVGLVNFWAREINRREWTNKALNDNACMLRTFELDPNLYQTEVYFFPWAKLKTVFPELIPAEVLEKYGMKF